MKVLLITPPMTQLNTPYPATAYLTGFLQQQGYAVTQRDLAIDLFLALLSKKGLADIYRTLEDNFALLDDEDLPDSVFHFFSHYEQIKTWITPCIRFLQGQDPSLAWRISGGQFCLEGPAFDHFFQADNFAHNLLEKAFGSLGIQDKAKFFATLFINDIIAAIRDGIDQSFELTRYGERLAASNPSFDDLYYKLQEPENFLSKHIHCLIQTYIQQTTPDVVGITVPFPGNILGALQAAASCKQIDPSIKIILGGGYINTELRSLKDPRVFEFVDFITLDDGERPLLSLLQTLSDQSTETLTRTYYLRDGHTVYSGQHPDLVDFSHSRTGCPSYQGLQLDRYLSFCEMLNPMHRIWSDGHWNKLTVAHGCYWKKCSFCDIQLSYISHYDPTDIEVLISRIKTLLVETGQTGFHFVDEAAPPKLLFALAEQLIAQNIIITWWCNIRFEKSYTLEKCQLLADSGCIAVTGGLEVASNRLLKLMKKGVSVEQVAQVTHNFSSTGIMVHAYLMYGFPTQTEQETVESLEMVRQLMLNGCFQSGFWHRFAATVHSPVGLQPDRYGIVTLPIQSAGFAENDLDFTDPVAADLELLGRGLNKAIYNYMHGFGFEHPVTVWFDKTLQQPDIDQQYIAKLLQ